jgi:hypothetical protein
MTAAPSSSCIFQWFSRRPEAFSGLPPVFCGFWRKSAVPARRKLTDMAARILDKLRQWSAMWVFDSACWQPMIEPLPLFDLFRSHLFRRL